ncbi:MAG: TetR/AcrR family transcriptional regulator [Betaproteobacteria bacterium]
MTSGPVRPLPAARAARGRKPATPRGPRSGLTPDDWVRAATQVLVDHGIDHVRVDVLAGELNVTRGSFYWHFRDREDLLRRVLQAWREEATVQLSKRLALARSEPRELLADVVTLPFRGRAAVRAARIELAIRAWARRDPMARQALEEADASRIGYHEALFRALGFAAEEAAHRAFLLYGYEVAESLMAAQGSEAERQARQRFVLQLAQQPLAGPR